MKPAPFIYHAAQTLGEAASLMRSLSEYGPAILAGGQSLVPMMALRLARPAHLIDINGVAELDAVTSEDGMLRIGAIVRHARFHSPEQLGPLGPLLAYVARHIAHYPIRQRGTFGGSLANADPASEWCLVAATLDGTMTAARADGTRQISATDYFQGVMTTALAGDEILSEFRLPQINPDTKWAFEEFAMRAGDFAQAMALVAFDVEDGNIANARIGVGAVEPFPRRVASAEEILNGAAPSADLFAAAGGAVAAALELFDDWQAPGEDRQQLAGALVRRTLHAAMDETLR